MAHSSKNASLKKLGHELDRDRKIYALFGLTALSDARNIISYLFDITNDVGENASDRMHLWLTSPLGLTLAIIESLFLVSLAIIGNYFEETHSNPMIRNIAFFWPFIRDGIKAVKNAYKGARSILFFSMAFGAAVTLAPHFLLPLGLTMGLTYLTSRIWYRNMCYQRKKMQGYNDDLRTLIEKYCTRDKSKTFKVINLKKLRKDANSECPLNAEKQQSASKLYEKLKAMAIFYNDDPLGVLTPSGQDEVNVEVIQSLLKTPNGQLSKKGYLSAALNGLFDGLYLFAGLAALCALAPQLLIAVHTVSLLFVALSIVRYLYEEYSFQRKLSASQLKTKISIDTIRLENTRGQQGDEKPIQQEIDLSEKSLKQISRYHYHNALGESIRDGLGLYSALTGLLIIVNIFMPIPVFLLLGTLGMGILAVSSFVIYNTWQTHRHIQSDNLDKLHENKFPDLAEILRSLFSGFKQGAKQSNFVLNAEQEMNEQGHYQSSDLIDKVALGLGFIISIIYGLKAVAKGFGRSKDELNLPSAVSPSDSENSELDVKKPSSAEELGSPLHRLGSKTEEDLTALSSSHLKQAANQFFSPPPSPPRVQDATIMTPASTA
jgi:hypothetical protein